MCPPHPSVPNTQCYELLMLFYEVQPNDYTSLASVALPIPNLQWDTGICDKNVRG